MSFRLILSLRRLAVDRFRSKRLIKKWKQLVFGFEDFIERVILVFTEGIGAPFEVYLSNKGFS